ncbi:TPA: hypothetical protein MB350_002301 [Klebsiella quasipneumoniae subsp. similipneumoniae]|nr:hypothetical protein [Klebsiella quasipneumoniae subsp. similipneumoniae]HBT4827939.1 hypothetical protein [Klebsiella quasipneumoniae subsp. similipneumoniae]
MKKGIILSSILAFCIVSTASAADNNPQRKHIGQNNELSAPHEGKISQHDGKEFQRDGKGPQHGGKEHPHDGKGPDKNGQYLPKKDNR